MNISRNLVRFGIFSATVALLLIVAKQMLGMPYVHDRIWTIFGFFFAMGILFFLINYYAHTLGDEIYAMGALAAIVIKLLASASFVAILLFQGLSNKLWFVADFFVVYLLFTVFEIKSIISNLRAQKKL